MRRLANEQSVAKVKQKKHYGSGRHCSKRAEHHGSKSHQNERARIIRNRLLERKHGWPKMAWY